MNSYEVTPPSSYIRCGACNFVTIKTYKTEISSFLSSHYFCYFVFHFHFIVVTFVNISEHMCFIFKWAVVLEPLLFSSSHKSWIQKLLLFITFFRKKIFKFIFFRQFSQTHVLTASNLTHMHIFSLCLYLPNKTTQIGFCDLIRSRLPTSAPHTHVRLPPCYAYEYSIQT